MSWCFYAIKIANKDYSPNEEWLTILDLLKKHKLVEIKVLGKIEVAAFAIRGSRLLRWRVKESDSEYCSEIECLNIAKKLLVYYLQLKDFEKEIPIDVRKCLNMSNEKVDVKCPLCLLEIEKEQFFKDARISPNATQMGHLNPLNLRGKSTSNHFADNINWQHRRCNYMQGEDTLENALEFMIGILQRHNKI